MSKHTAFLQNSTKFTTKAPDKESKIAVLGQALDKLRGELQETAFASKLEARSLSIDVRHPRALDRLATVKRFAVDYDHRIRSAVKDPLQLQTTKAPRLNLSTVRRRRWNRLVDRQVGDECA